AGAARRQRQSAAQPQPRQPLSRDEPRSQINGPASSGSSERKDAARARRQESMPYTALPEKPRHAAQGIALADASEIQLDAGRREVHRAVRFVKEDSAHAHDAARSLDFFDRRQPALAAQEAPASAERSRRDVERAAGAR